VRQLDPSITASRALNFFAYTWGEISELPAKSQSGMLEKFERYGFDRQSAGQALRESGADSEILSRYRKQARQAGL
jgi:DNA ligase (NAD+)